MRTDNDPIALQAFWDMHVEAMNFSGMRYAEHAVALVSQRIRCAFGATLDTATNGPAVDRQRFTDEQKRAMVQATEKPGAAGGGCVLPHGIATSQLFRWRGQFGLTARKTQQLATVILADGAANQAPALSTSRDLVRPPKGMTAIVMEIAQPA